MCVFFCFPGQVYCNKETFLIYAKCKGYNQHAHLSSSPIITSAFHTHNVNPVGCTGNKCLFGPFGSQSGLSVAVHRYVESPVGIIGLISLQSATAFVKDYRMKLRIYSLTHGCRKYQNKLLQSQINDNFFYYN